MLKMEINGDDVSLSTNGKGFDVLAESILAVYVMARHFKKHGDEVADYYRKFLLKALSDKDEFFKCLDDDYITPDLDATEDGSPCM